jgi:hypothetical protein
VTTYLERTATALHEGAASVVVAPPGEGEGFWAGGPSVVHEDGVFWLAYRLRRPVDQGRGYANVVARSDDGVHFTTVATLLNSSFIHSASLERPALVRRADGGWRLYVSCSSRGSKHWWVEAVDADTPEQLVDGVRTVVLAGDADTAWKDVVVRRDGDHWQMWACKHLLDDGEDNADRMQSWYLTSTDGLQWHLSNAALLPRPGQWDGRGARITSVLELDGQWVAFYDGRASADDNWHELTGVATGSGPDAFVASGGPVDRHGRTLRYLSLAQLPDGLRFFFEAGRADGANDLSTVFVPFEEPAAPTTANDDARV